ncbi:MAG TPA: hypothetical protein ENI23_09915 [bacterium]|nr:hypothetical protein [bacterium]
MFGQETDQQHIPFPEQSVDLALAMKEDRAIEIIERGFREASVDEIEGAIGYVETELLKEDINPNSIEYYRQLAAQVPYRLSEEVQWFLIRALSSDDEYKEESRRAKRLLILLNLGKILTVTEKLAGLYDGSQVELVHVGMIALEALFESIAEGKKSFGDLPLSFHYNRKISDSVLSFIAEYCGMPGVMVLYEDLRNEVSNYIQVYPEGRKKDKIMEFVNDLAGRYDIKKREILWYLRFSFQSSSNEVEGRDPYDQMEIMGQIVEEYFKGDERLLKVIKLRFWEGLTLEQIGKRVGVTGSRVGMLVQEGLHRLRGPRISGQVRHLLDENAVVGWSAAKMENEKDSGVSRVYPKVGLGGETMTYCLNSIKQVLSG